MDSFRVTHSDRRIHIDRSAALVSSHFAGAAVPLRRELFEDWFRIVLRYGRIGGEEVFYEPDLKDPIIQFPILPTRSGELFVFINDAVIGFPWVYNLPSWLNGGTAKLTIRRTR